MNGDGDYLNRAFQRALVNTFSPAGEARRKRARAEELKAEALSKQYRNAPDAAQARKAAIEAEKAALTAERKAREAAADIERAARAALGDDFGDSPQKPHEGMDF